MFDTIREQGNKFPPPTFCPCLRHGLFLNGNSWCNRVTGHVSIATERTHRSFKWMSQPASQRWDHALETQNWKRSKKNITQNCTGSPCKKSYMLDRLNEMNAQVIYMYWMNVLTIKCLSELSKRLKTMREGCFKSFKNNHVSRHNLWLASSRLFTTPWTWRFRLATFNGQNQVAQGASNGTCDIFV